MPDKIKIKKTSFQNSWRMVLSVMTSAIPVSVTLIPALGFLISCRALFEFLNVVNSLFITLKIICIPVLKVPRWQENLK